MSLYRVLALPLNHDVGWLLYLSERVLEGDRLYVDLIEVNPPLIIWLGMPVILLERLLGVHHTLLFPILVGIGAGLSIAACWRLAGYVVAPPYRAPVMAALAGALFVVPSGNWGQREHLMLLLASPYVFACAARARGDRPGGSVITGIAAGIGFAIKPHFLLLPLALEAWLWVSRRTFSPGVRAMAGTVAAYGLAALVVTPEYIPMMRQFMEPYSAFVSHPLRRVLLSSASLLIALTLPLALVRGEGAALRGAMGVTAAASLAIAIGQGKGFYYHFIPGLAAAVLLISLAFVAVAREHGRRALASLPPLLLALLLLMEVSLRPPAQDVRWEKVADVRSAAIDRPALILSLAPSDCWPFINYARSRWPMALSSVWPARREVGAGAYAALHVARGLEDHPVVLVPTQPGRAALPELLNHEVFRHAWAEYTLQENLNHYQVYRTSGRKR